MATRPVPMTFGLVTEDTKSPKKKPAKKKPTGKKIHPVYCPQCGKEMCGWNLKFNDKDFEGHLVEGYRCDECGKKFTITYEGRTDRSHWWLDDDEYD